jgi:hypothetical protein
VHLQIIIHQNLNKFAIKGVSFIQISMILIKFIFKSIMIS